MVRIQKKIPVEYVGNEVSRYYIEATCSNDDDKPSEKIAGGSSIVETDTGIVSLYNEATEAWVPQFSIKQKIEE